MFVFDCCDIIILILLRKEFINNASELSLKMIYLLFRLDDDDNQDEHDQYDL